MRFHTAVNKFCLSSFLGEPLPIWKGMLNKHKPYLSLRDAFKVLKFTIENNFFKNTSYNILSENLTLKVIINYLRKFDKNIVIKLVKSKLINQYSYKISKEKFNKQGLLLKAKIYQDIKSTMSLFKNINNEK